MPNRTTLIAVITAAFALLVGVIIGANINNEPKAKLSTASVELAATAHYGALQAAVHQAGLKRGGKIVATPIVPFIRTQRVGSAGPAVFQLQRALKAAHLRSGKATGFYGAATGRQVSRFQQRNRIQPSGVYGLVTHKRLSRFYDAEGRARLQAVAHTRAYLDKVARIVHAASVAWTKRNSMRYSQSSSRGFLPYLPNVPYATDCSGYATWIYKVSSLPDPSGFAYRIVGYTGTLAQHGVRISSGVLHVGDLVFYGGGYPYGHVTIVVDAIRRLVSSHGSPGIRVLPYNYRTVSVIRRYFN